MSRRRSVYLEVLIDSLKEIALMNAINVPVSALASLYFRAGLFSTYGVILLLEAAVLMLIGGALDFAGSSTIRNLPRAFRREAGQRTRDAGRRTTTTTSNVQRAAVFTVTGVALFLEAVLLSVPFLPK